MLKPEDNVGDILESHDKKIEALERTLAGLVNKHIKCHIERYSLWIILFCTAINMLNTVTVKSTYNKLIELVDIINTELSFVISNEDEYHQRVDELIQSSLDLNESVRQLVETVFDYSPLSKDEAN